MFDFTKTIVAFLGLFITASAFCQKQADTIAYLIESGVVASPAKNTPFWLLSNNYGTISSHSPNVWARAAISGHIGITSKVRFDFGADIINRYSHQNEFMLQQAYAGAKLGFITLKGGAWEEKFGNQDSSLSSGGLIWSGNARPIPKISLFVPEYTPVPFTRGYAEFKGGISHGWFKDNQFISNVWLHQKYIYLRLGGSLPVHVEYGLQHFAQWGGESADPMYGKLPADFKAFLKVFFGRGGGENAPAAESLNAIGNHIGSHNLAIDYRGNKISLKLYWQSIFEDGSGLRLKNIRDGLWGLGFYFADFKPLTGIIAEYINTTNQSGPSGYYSIDSTIVIGTGNDNYFNSGIYASGWTNQEMTIGTPLITSHNLLPNWPSPYLGNNRVTAFHLGFEGKIGIFNYKTFYTYSRNYGTFNSPFPDRRDQHSVLIKSTFSILPWDILTSVAIAFDIGKLLDNNVGFCVCLRKVGLLNWKVNPKR